MIQALRKHFYKNKTIYGTICSMDEPSAPSTETVSNPILRTRTPASDSPTASGAEELPTERSARAPLSPRTMPCSSTALRAGAGTTAPTAAGDADDAATLRSAGGAALFSAATASRGGAFCASALPSEAPAFTSCTTDARTSCVSENGFFSSDRAICRSAPLTARCFDA